MFIGPQYYKKNGIILLSFGLIGLSLMYGLLLYYPSEDRILNFERDIAVSLNKSVAHNAIWDWTVQIASSRFFLMLSYVIAVGSVITWSWLRRTQDLGRVLGYAVWVLLWALLAQEVGNEISNFIQRDPPRVATNELSNLHLLYSQTPDASAKTGVPDAHVLGIVCMALLLTIRARAVGLSIFPILLFHIVGQLSVGNRWLLDILGATLFGSVFAGGGLVLLARPLSKLERASEDLFLRRFWSWMPTTFECTANPEEFRSEKLIPTEVQFTSEQKLRKERYFRSVIAREVLPLFNVTMNSVQVLQQPEGELGDDWKGSSSVRYLKLPSNEIFVLKLAQAIWGLHSRSGRIQRAIRHARSNLALERLGMPVPRLYWLSEGRSPTRLVRHIIVVEEYLQGRTLIPDDETDILEAMGMLAKLHDNLGTGWGALAHTSTASAASYLWNELRPRTLYMINRIASWYGPHWPDGLTDRIWNLFREQYEIAMADGPPHFRLIHGDVGVRNLMRTSKGIYMIDFTTVRFDIPGAEIIRSVNSLTKRNPVMRQLAWSAYFSAASRTRWHEFLRTANFDLARFALRELAHHRALGLRPNSHPPDASKIHSWLVEIFSLDASDWGISHEETNWNQIAALLFDPLEGMAQ